ncbi:MarR family winged helix-turn-helix transcriptional regulator [Brevibacillus gelatini]|uniref:MarR family transcriptional regulator n=1 Tax=Brevibacillus gelatini TaxID=1655277 RepID=A0A3M8BDH6_9BACL|nr:MarR family transcriptional regulator [Brevibacillus gelatini]RNB61481.1 MarR family transcriptional regulator [Brevibacillus gelatini]
MPSQSGLTEFEQLYIQVQRSVSAKWHKRLDPLVSASQAMLLRMLDKHGPLKASALAELLQITPGAVTSLSDKLIACGYASRSRVSHDRRVVCLDITEKGKAMLQQYKVELKRTIGDLFAGLSEEDLAHLNRIYRHVLHNIEQQREENDA